MNFDELLDKIVASGPEDWHAISCDDAPSYRERFTLNEYALETDGHSDIAVYKPDLSITLAFGMPLRLAIYVEWLRKFSEERSRLYVDVFYNNGLAFRHECINVFAAGRRAFLPLPNEDSREEVPQRYHDFIRLVNSLSGSTTGVFDSHFRRAGFRTVNETWPRLRSVAAGA